MFGGILTNSAERSSEERERYQRFYCGLCRKLKADYGAIGMASLTYDMTFVAILLSSLYELEEEEDRCRCAMRPVRSHPYVITAATEYSADMNMILAYYQYGDDWQDDGNARARRKAEQVEPYLPAIRQKHPRQCAAIEDCLAELGEMERANELNPDLPANCFGKLMGELLAWRADEYAGTLRSMGAALGRFVYLLDAVNDLKADIRKQRYNPLVSQLAGDYTPMLTLMMAECTAEFETLPVNKDRHLLENILYSGVWQSYRTKRKGDE